MSVLTRYEAYVARSNLLLVITYTLKDDRTLGRKKSKAHCWGLGWDQIGKQEQCGWPMKNEGQQARDS